MPTLSSILKDVRALGTSAPLRAAYEGSKRTNAHRYLFREVPGGHRSRPIPVGNHVPTTEVARQRCLTDAALIAEHGTRVFARRAGTGVHSSWATDPLTGRCWPEDTPWWQIDIRSEARMSDVKYVWEAARHRDLVVLARAAVLEPDGPWLDTLEAMLIRWCRECRPERGVNWYSSLELALRAIAWNQVLALVGDRLHAGLRAELDDQLVASARHILVELPYTMTSMKNNHLLGDGLGLVVLGRMFPDHPGSRRWQAIGDRLMLKQLSRHMRPDGSMIEDSLSYHRFVLEMLIVRVLIGDAPAQVVSAMRGAAQHLVNLGVLDGPVPQYGDWDEGRVLTDSAEAGSVAGAALLGRHLAGEPVDTGAWDDLDELAWYAEPPAGEGGAITTHDGPWASGHFSGAVHGDWRVWLKRDLTQSHQHADLTSVWVRGAGGWVIEDPGTGTYNGPLEIRNGFRTSAAHPVWHPADRDLLGPHRAFRWEQPTVHCGYGHGGDETMSLLLSWHDGWTEGRATRVVLVDASGVVVLDHLPDGARDWTMTVPEGVGASGLHGLEGTATTGEQEPFAGWHSPTYGSWSPRPWRTVRSDGGWVVWGVGRPVPAQVEGMQVTVEDMTVRLADDGGDGMTVAVDRKGVTVTVEAPRA